ncbi:MAG: hypothetical protein RBT22_07240 [Aliarcobacter sp.]|jgi:hypothetical protein|nr:hypothetical protein [Aliarcobacter sp.]
MNDAIIGLLGVVAGALLSSWLNYLLERKKLDFDLIKYSYDVKRQKLEEMFLLLRDIKISSKKSMNDFMHINTFNEIKISEKDIEKSFSHRFIQFKNYVNMYFYDDLELNKMIEELNILHENILVINGKTFNKDIEKINNKQEIQKLNSELFLTCCKFDTSIENVEKYLPEIYKKLIPKR